MGAVVSKPKPRVRPHVFTPDPDLGVDHNGRRTCRCGLPGQAGDAHHTVPDAPAVDVQQRAAGERSEG
jgi:hypothetical protein